MKEGPLAIQGRTLLCDMAKRKKKEEFFAARTKSSSAKIQKFGIRKGNHHVAQGNGPLIQIN